VRFGKTIPLVFYEPQLPDVSLQLPSRHSGPVRIS